MYLNLDELTTGDRVTVRRRLYDPSWGVVTSITKGEIRVNVVGGTKRFSRKTGKELGHGVHSFSTSYLSHVDDYNAWVNWQQEKAKVDVARGQAKEALAKLEKMVNGACTPDRLEEWTGLINKILEEAK
jgi:hypothetical protein